MDMIETQKILHVLSVTYPNSIKASDQDTFLLAQIWQRQFKDIPYKAVIEAVGEWMNTTNVFAPTIGQLKAFIFRPDPRMADSELAWQSVRDAMHELAWNREHDKQIWQELPEEIKRCVSYDELVNMAMSSPADNDRFKKPAFVKAYASTVESTVSEKIYKLGMESRKEIENK